MLVLLIALRHLPFWRLWCKGPLLNPYCSCNSQCAVQHLLHAAQLLSAQPPSLLRAPVMDTSTSVQIVVAESYGGKDEPVDTLVASLVDINVSPIFDPLRVKETPDQAIYQAYEETGTDLAQVG